MPGPGSWLFHHACLSACRCGAAAAAHKSVSPHFCVSCCAAGQYLPKTGLPGTLPIVPAAAACIPCLSSPVGICSTAWGPFSFPPPFRPRTRRLGLHSPDVLAGRVRQQPAGQVGRAGWVAAAAGRLLLTSCFVSSGSKGSHVQPAGHVMQQEQSAPPLRCLHALLTPLPGRPGNLYQDSVSAYCVLDPSFWTSYHTFGLVSACWWVGGLWGSRRAGTGQWPVTMDGCRRTCSSRGCSTLHVLTCPPACRPVVASDAQHWVPGDYVRWYVDGHFVYEVGRDCCLEPVWGAYCLTLSPATANLAATQCSPSSAPVRLRGSPLAGSSAQSGLLAAGCSPGRRVHGLHHLLPFDPCGRAAHLVPPAGEQGGAAGAVQWHLLHRRAPHP